MSRGVPQTRVAPMSETLHGETFEDPYRWLEEESAELRAWTEEQNAYSAATLGAQPGREGLRGRLAKLLAAGYVMSPKVKQGRLFFVKREGGQNQPCLYVREGEGARLVLDPNVLSAKGTIALDWWYPSPDGALVAYGLSSDGDERSTLHIRDVATGEELAERIPDSRFSSVAWLPDGSGFYYTRLPARGSVPPGDENYNSRVRFHQLGANPDEDPIIYGEGRAAEESKAVKLSPNGRWLLVSGAIGWAKNDLYLLDRWAEQATLVPLIEGREALYSGQVRDDRIYVTTNEGAPNFRVFRVSLDAPGREHWVEVVPERDAPLQSCLAIGDRLVLTYLRDATAEVRIVTDTGAGEASGALTAQLPGLGSVSEVDGEEGSAYFTYTSFFDPPGVWHCDLATGVVTPVELPVSAPDTAAFITEQVWYTSYDGTRVPMFLLRRRDLPRDGVRPTVLTGYGGFNIAMTPGYQAPFLDWIERGGIVAQPSLRGGSEYGEAWHRAGMLGNKQRVFEDFIAAGEALIAEGWTSSDHLGIRGGSNGGLLVGAAMTQRPELWKAVVCLVPLLDMLRYQHFLIARLWIPEYGSSEDPEQCGWLRAYSPYHNVVAGTHYPATLLTAAESDSRVHPLHARKMAALLQASTASDPAEYPILVRLETEAGHGAGKPQSKVLDEQVDVWGFLGWQLGMTNGE